VNLADYLSLFLSGHNVPDKLVLIMVHPNPSVLVLRMLSLVVLYVVIAIINSFTRSCYWRKSKQLLSHWKWSTRG